MLFKTRRIPFISVKLYMPHAAEQDEIVPYAIIFCLRKFLIVLISSNFSFFVEMAVFCSEEIPQAKTGKEAGRMLGCHVPRPVSSTTVLNKVKYMPEPFI
jgi:hypothetical protein